MHWGPSIPAIFGHDCLVCRVVEQAREGQLGGLKEDAVCSGAWYQIA